MERGDGGGGMAARGGVVGSAAMLGLDMHLAPQQMHPVAFQADHHHHVAGGFQLQQAAPAPVRQQQQQPPPSSFSPYSNSSSRVHDEEMAGNGKGGGGVQQQQQAGCPWTRMKWTDAMVRLLIRVVYSVGDDGEGGAAAGGGGGGGAKPKAGSSAAHAHAHAQQQKKGKWKSVSRAVMDSGFMVSPQQCEDKFNDLNKRYKRVVDLLGRGRACRVVENHALLDAIDELSPKAKDEARKLLSSKHLFFREMCAYHNSGASHGVSISHAPAQVGGDASAAAAAACLHHPPPQPMAAASSAARHAHPSPTGTKDSSADAADDDSEDGVSNNDDDDEDDYDEDDDGGAGHIYPNHQRHHHHRGSNGNGHGHHHHHHRNKRARGADDNSADFEDDADGSRGRGAPGEKVQQLQSELASATAADPSQARSWVRRRAVEVEREQVDLEWHAQQLETQRLRWERFRGNKEREMQRQRLRSDRAILDGQRMLLMLRQRDLELDIAEANSSSVEHHHPAQLAAGHHQMGSSPSTAGHPN